MKSNITISKKLGVISGSGELPIVLAKAAKENGLDLTAICLSGANQRNLSKYCSVTYNYGPGELKKILAKLQQEEINQLIFIGKVHKGLLFKNPKVDSKAISLMKQVKKLNDDLIMLTLIEELEKENIKVIDQSLFLKDLLISKGQIGKHVPTKEQLLDIDYGFHIAKEMGGLDIGQSVIVQDKMILAVEAIEGTDRAIKRGGQLSNGKAVVVKVSKPGQDCRFDIPTVGLNTLKTMKKYGATVLAIEADKTFVVQKKEMIKFADKNNMVFIAI